MFAARTAGTRFSTQRKYRLRFHVPAARDGAACTVPLRDEDGRLGALLVLGVPVQTKALNGMDSLLSIVQMPAGVAVGTLAIGQAGAKNAALLAVRVLANEQPELRKRLKEFATEQESKVMEDSEL